MIPFFVSISVSFFDRNGLLALQWALSLCSVRLAVLAMVPASCHSCWLLFGHFWGLPPLIGLLSTWELWKPNEALAGLVIQILLFLGALWAFQAAGLGDLTILFVVFSAINGVMMAPAMIQEKKDEVKKLEADNSD